MRAPRIYVILNGYNNPTVIRNAVKRFYDQTDIDGLDISFHLIDSLYPLPNFEENRLALFNICEEHLWAYIRLDKNEGQNGNFNKITEIWKKDWNPAREDIIAFWEPDSNVNNRAWLRSCVTLFDKAYHHCGFITPGRLPEWILTNNGEERLVADIKVRQLTWPGGWPMGIYRWGFIEDMKQLPVSHRFYGGTEGNILHCLNVTNHIGLMMTEILDPGTIEAFDPEYIGWKAETIRLPSEQQLEFTEWLKKRNG